MALFDLDNTLVDRTSGLRHWTEEFARERGLDTAAIEWIVGADDHGLKPWGRFFAEVRDRRQRRSPAPCLPAAVSAFPPLPPARP
ncbi:MULTISPECIES: hypothetical protein [Streptomyces]|uniref:hypothetical protein n=1 Tax=Streptomyces TaxID=1883 RepID=UPI00345BAA48